MATRKPAVKGKAAQTRVSAKISHLHKAEPGKSHKQHVAMALGMERAHRLGPKGAYKPVHKQPAKRTPAKKRR